MRKGDSAEVEVSSRGGQPSRLQRVKGGRRRDCSTSAREIDQIVEQVEGRGKGSVKVDIGRRRGSHRPALVVVEPASVGIRVISIDRSRQVDLVAD